MRPVNVSARHLRAFLALAEQRNFTRAAEQLNLSQPAFSALVAALEEAAGARLFDRTTRTVELTDAGRVLQEWIPALVGDLDAAFNAVADQVALRRGRVGIAVAPSLAAHWLPTIIADYHRAWPDVSIRLYDRLSDECIRLLRDGTVDIALTGIRGPEADLATELLLADRLRVVCHRSHPLATATRLRVADLAGHNLLHLVGSSNTRQQLDSALSATLNPGTTPIQIEVVHLTSLIGLVNTGLGISVLPTFSLARFDSPELVSIELVEPELYRTFHIVRIANRTLTAPAHDLLERLRAGRARLTGNTP